MNGTRVQHLLIRRVISPVWQRYVARLTEYTNPQSANSITSRLRVIAWIVAVDDEELMYTFQTKSGFYRVILFEL